MSMATIHRTTLRFFALLLVVLFATVLTPAAAHASGSQCTADLKTGIIDVNNDTPTSILKWWGIDEWEDEGGFTGLLDATSVVGSTTTTTTFDVASTTLVVVINNSTGALSGTNIAAVVGWLEARGLDDTDGQGIVEALGSCPQNILPTAVDATLKDIYDDVGM